MFPASGMRSMRADIRSRQIRDVEPMLPRWSSGVADAEPIVKQRLLKSRVDWDNMIRGYLHCFVRQATWPLCCAIPISCKKRQLMPIAYMIIISININTTSIAPLSSADRAQKAHKSLAWPYGIIEVKAGSSTGNRDPEDITTLNNKTMTSMG